MPAAPKHERSSHLRNTNSPPALTVLRDPVGPVDRKIYMNISMKKRNINIFFSSYEKTDHSSWRSWWSRQTCASLRAWKPLWIEDITHNIAHCQSVCQHKRKIHKKNKTSKMFKGYLNTNTRLSLVTLETEVKKK